MHEIKDKTDNFVDFVDAMWSGSKDPLKKTSPLKKSFN